MIYLSVISLFALLLSFFSFGLSLWLFVEHRATTKSTHKIQFVPLAEELAKVKQNPKSYNEMSPEAKQMLEEDDLFGF